MTNCIDNLPIPDPTYMPCGNSIPQNQRPIILIDKHGNCYENNVRIGELKKVKADYVVIKKDNGEIINIPFVLSYRKLQELIAILKYKRKK